jgi:hypothetical protein
MTTAKVRMGLLQDAFTCMPEMQVDGIEINAYSQTETENVGVHFVLTYEKAEELANDILRRVEKKRAKAKSQEKGGS